MAKTLKIARETFTAGDMMTVSRYFHARLESLDGSIIEEAAFDYFLHLIQDDWAVVRPGSVDARGRLGAKAKERAK